MKLKAFIVGMALSAMVAGSAMAQEAPGPGGHGPRPDGPEGRDGRGPGGDRDHGPGRDGDRDGDRPGMGGMGMGFGRGDGDGFMLPPQMRMFQGYMMMVEQSARMSRDESTSGVAAVIMAGDLMKKKGPEATISYYNGLLSDVKDPAVERAIRFQLVELYKRSNQPDKALGELTHLITGKPTTQPTGK
jgi:hypothetical protein